MKDFLIRQACVFRSQEHSIIPFSSFGIRITFLVTPHLYFGCSPTSIEPNMSALGIVQLNRVIQARDVHIGHKIFDLPFCFCCSRHICNSHKFLLPFMVLFLFVLPSLCVKPLRRNLYYLCQAVPHSTIFYHSNCPTAPLLPLCQPPSILTHSISPCTHIYTARYTHIFFVPP
jgi:hypothetical protein